MLTLANIISHYRASASPSRVPNCTLWTWLHLAPPVWESGATVRKMWGGGARDHSLLSQGLWGRKGCSFFSRVIFGHYMCQRILWEYASVLICILSVCVGTSMCVGGVVSMEWTVAWKRKTNREVLSLGARCRWWNRWKGVFRKPREKMVQVILQQLQLSAEGLAPSFLSSFMGSGNSLYNSTSVSCLRALRAIVWNACSTFMASLALVSK